MNGSGTQVAQLAALGALLGAACFSWGFSVGRGSHEELRAERSAALAALARANSPPAAPAHGECAVSVDPQILRSELAKALQNAGVQAPGAVAAAPSAEPPSPPSPPPSPEQIAAFDRARTMVDSALTRGAMTATEARDLRDQLAALDPDSRQDVTLRIIRAMNRDQLKFEDHQLPF